MNWWNSLTQDNKVKLIIVILTAFLGSVGYLLKSTDANGSVKSTEGMSIDSSENNTTTIHGSNNTVNIKTLSKNKKCDNPVYKIGRGKICGVELYKNIASVECGVLEYNTGSAAVCGVDQYHRCETGACGWNRCLFIEKCDAKECRNRNCGVERYKVCKDSIFGVKAYKTCRNEKHGIETYKACRNEEFGVEQCK